MKLSELKERLNSIVSKYHEADVLIDTECAEFMCHMVEPTDIDVIDKEVFGRDIVIIGLDNNVKKHQTMLDKTKEVLDYLKNEYAHNDTIHASVLTLKEYF